MSDPIPGPLRVNPIGKGVPSPSQPTESFSSYMKGTGTNMQKTAAPSPFDLLRGETPIAQGTTLKALSQQASRSGDLLDNINDLLGTPKLALKRSLQKSLKTHLKEAQASLETLNTKWGNEVPPKSPTPEGSGFLDKLLGLVSNGQDNLQAIQKKLSSLAKGGKNLDPAAFLEAQLAMGRAQQNIELASIILSKAVEAFKTLMNIQI